jgi:hypothetical protein
VQQIVGVGVQSRCEHEIEGGRQQRDRRRHADQDDDEQPPAEAQLEARPATARGDHERIE